MKGVHVRISQDSTLEEAHAKIEAELKEQLGVDSKFELFEVCQDSRNKKCRILRNFR